MPGENPQYITDYDQKETIARARQLMTDEEREMFDQYAESQLQGEVRGTQSTAPIEQKREDLIMALGGYAFGDIRAAESIPEMLFAVIDRDLEQQLARLEQGGEGTQLLTKYEKHQKEIDKIIALNPPEAAAKLLNKRFDLNLTARDVTDVDAAMAEATGQDAVARRTGVKADVLKRVSGAAKGLLTEEALRRSNQKLGSLAMSALRESGGSAGGLDNVDIISQSIQSLSAQGFSADPSDSLDAQTLSYGVDIFNEIQRVSGDGLTLEEISTASGLSEDQAADLVKRMGGTTTGGRVRGVDTKDLSGRVAGMAASSLELNTDKERILNRGMTDMERQSISVRKTSEQVEKTALTLERLGVLSETSSQVGNPGEKDDP
jgi:hypothetical protein